jgi:pyroglutamyl-peptidase
MHIHRPTLLLTGFGPFPNVPANATAVLVPRIAEAAEQAFPGVRVACHILPTEWSAGLARVADLYRDLQPVAAIHFGVAGRAKGFEIEARGRNACAQSPDAAGLLPNGPRVSPWGPEFLASSLPIAHIVDRLRRRGIPAILSRDAGAYLCNALLYRAQELARSSPLPARSGFIHLPASLVNERYVNRGPLGRCRLDWDAVVDGGVEVISATLSQSAVALRRGRMRLG